MACFKGDHLQALIIFAFRIKMQINISRCFDGFEMHGGTVTVQAMRRLVDSLRAPRLGATGNVA
jgi:hypothetical protein